MTLLAVIRKSALQQRRDVLGTALTLGTAPLFVCLYWLFFGQATASVTLGLVRPTPQTLLRALEGPGQDLTLRHFSTRQAANEALDDHSVDALVLPAPDFAQALDHKGQSSRVTLYGDASTAQWRLAQGVLQERLQALETQPPRVALLTQAQGRSAARTPFEAYVPGLMVFAVMMLVFSTAMAVARECQADTLERLRMTPLGAWRILAGISVVQLVMGAASVGLTFGAASLLGFQSQGSLWLAIGLGCLASAACIGFGVAVGGLTRTVSQAFVLASVVMFLLMIFSGVVFPVPSLAVTTFAGRSWGPFSLLPTTHAIEALRRVLLLGQPARDIWVEALAMLVLSSLGFGFGVLVWGRRYGRFQPTKGDA